MASRENYTEANVSVADQEKMVIPDRKVQRTYCSHCSSNSQRTTSVILKLGVFFGSQIFIQGLQNLNRAVHDDIVAIEMLKEEDWTCPSSVILVHTEEKDDTDEEEEKEVCVCVCVVLEWEQYIN